MSGRANAALNLLHVGMSFMLQTGFGFIIAQWPQSNEGYPAEAHRSAMATLLGLQIIALVWFGASARAHSSLSKGGLSPSLSQRHARWRLASVRLIFAATQRERLANIAWPFAAASSALLCFTLLANLTRALSHSAVAVHFVARVSVDLPGPSSGIDRGPPLPFRASIGKRRADWKK
jgi:hypothetical protein